MKRNILHRTAAFGLAVAVTLGMLASLGHVADVQYSAAAMTATQQLAAANPATPRT